MPIVSPFLPGMSTPVVVAVGIGLLGYVYQALKPPPPKICGSPGGPLVTCPRIKLRDGRHLAYKETGVSKEQAKFKVIIVHGFGDSKDIDIAASQELIEELGIYFLSFDRAGYGESDPNPSRSVKSEAFDIQELADNLNIGAKFYVIGFSMGAYSVYSCLKYIPHRLSGVALVVPAVNFWWPHLPTDLLQDGLKTMLPQDQWCFRVAHYAPWLLYWWITQKWFPSLSIMSGNTSIFSESDLEILKKVSESPSPGQDKSRDHESLHRDLIVNYGKWEFGPTELSNPFPSNEGSVHLWQATEDRIIPRQINRYIAKKLPWIHYHEVSKAGHLMALERKNYEAILNQLLIS